jgi:integrase
MPPRAAGLSAAKVRTAPPGRYGDGIGLYLLVRGPDARFWLYRYTRPGRMREMGLGPAVGRGAVSLADARVKARRLHDAVREGRDPLAERDAARAAARSVQARGKTFGEVAGLYIAAHEAGWRNAQHRQQWTNTLRDHALPVLGAMPVDAIETGDVMSALEPFWRILPETASRVRGRIELVLDFARSRGWRTGENPARWKGHLANLLPARAKLAAVEHHAALPWREAGQFMAEVRKQDGVAARALEFAVLTAARAGEVVGANWDEIDLQQSLWTVPAARMKSAREHRVPLSDAAMDVLEFMTSLRNLGGCIFPGRSGRGLYRRALTEVIRRIGRREITTHGFRSCFPDWCAETGQPSEIAEAALAHTLGNKTAAAYQRGDLLERRRRLMQAWAVYCARPALPASVARLRA